MVEISSLMTDGPGGILFPMTAGGPMQGICRVDEWADVHEYPVDGWAEVVRYYVDGCTKVDVYQVDRYVKGTCYHIHGWAQTHIRRLGRECYIKYCIRRVGRGWYKI
jgi:hypothetical protein